MTHAERRGRNAIELNIELSIHSTRCRLWRLHWKLIKPNNNNTKHHVDAIRQKQRQPTGGENQKK